MIHPKITVKTNKARLQKLKAEFERAKGAYVAVGVHEGAGEYDDGPSVVQVALWNEFGTHNIPSRPFIRSAIHGKVAEINAWRAEVIKKILSGDMTIKKALEVIGFRLRETIRNNINSNMPPPNAPSVVAYKKSQGIAPRTLVETALLLRSVEFKVVGV